jgi:hypothetical protein
MTQHAAAAPEPQQFTIGRVLETTFAVLIRNIVPFGVFAIGLGLLELLVVWAGEAIVSGATGTATGAGDQATWGTWAPSVLLGIGLALLGVVMTSLVSAAVSYGVFQDLRGRRASIGDCLSRGLASILPLVAAAVLFSLLVGVGWILLVIPGVLAWLAYWLYIPAIVVEKRSITESFGRSAFLTRGRRWTIVGLWLVVLIGLQIGSTVLTKILAPTIGEWSSSVVLFIWQSAWTAFNAVMITVSYCYLRADKEGVAIDEIAKVFD